ncbi:hypothetical protein LV35_04179 [Acinetobacter baumannii]|uniref:Uncharacterized protein n=1 Tax=Acinetobacter baumannii TaxID=470 RepID=A0AAJ0QTB0_ACIBA|nr:hypothetical protein LV35_04179 [Acinetobacter baumannii]
MKHRRALVTHPRPSVTLPLAIVVHGHAVTHLGRAEPSAQRNRAELRHPQLIHFRGEQGTIPQSGTPLAHIRHRRHDRTRRMRIRRMHLRGDLIRPTQQATMPNRERCRHLRRSRPRRLRQTQRRADIFMNDVPNMATSHRLQHQTQNEPVVVDVLELGARFETRRLPHRQTETRLIRKRRLGEQQPQIQHVIEVTLLVEHIRPHHHQMTNLDLVGVSDPTQLKLRRIELVDRIL